MVVTRLNHERGCPRAAKENIGFDYVDEPFIRVPLYVAGGE
jgi:hypothetical protein